MDLRPVVEAVHAGRLKITDHAGEEAHTDGLSLDDIRDSLVQGETIEDYPADRPYPSCLVYGPTRRRSSAQRLGLQRSQQVGSSRHRVSTGPVAMGGLAPQEAQR